MAELNNVVNVTMIDTTNSATALNTRSIINHQLLIECQLCRRFCSIRCRLFNAVNDFKNFEQ